MVLKNRNRRISPNFFYEASIAFNKPKKDTRKQNNIPMSLINTDAKMLANCIQVHIKNVINHDQVSFIPEFLEWVNIIKMNK